MEKISPVETIVLFCEGKMGRSPGGANEEERALMPESPKSQLKMQMDSANFSSSRKRVKNQIVVIRRSERLKNSVLQNQDIAPVIEEILAIESEKEDQPQAHRKKKLPGPALDERSLEEKMDYLFQLLEAQQKTLQEMKPKATKRSSLNHSPCETDVGYKSLYLESQTKIKALTEENYQLGKKLENALGKLEVYEKGAHVFSEVLEKLKDVILASNVGKATETAINLSSQAILGGVSSPDAVIEPRTLPPKRKRSAKESRRN